MAELSRLARAREAWRSEFGGGLVPFDQAYWQAIEAGQTIAQAQALGVNAVLDAFVAAVDRGWPDGG